jgi:hypothetical protein
MARDVRKSLGDHVIRRGLDRPGEPLREGAAHVDGDRDAAGELGDGRRKTLVRQRGRVDAAGELAELGGRLGEAADRLLEQLGGGVRVVTKLRLDHPQRQSQHHEPLLRTVVKVALDLSTGRILGGDDPRARGLQLGDPRLFGFTPAEHVLRALALGDVEDHTVKPRFLVGLDDTLAALEDPHDLSVGSDDPVLEGERPILRRGRPHLAFHLRSVVGVDDAGEGSGSAADEVGCRIAGDALDLVADHGHRPVGIERTAIDRTGHVGDEGSKLDVAPVRLDALRTAELTDA